MLSQNNEIALVDNAPLPILYDIIFNFQYSQNELDLFLDNSLNN